MVLDHLLYNKQKWFHLTDSDSQTIDGKQYFKAPKQVKINEVGDVVAFGDSTPVEDATYSVVGAGTDWYIVYGPVRQASETNITYGNLVFLKSKVTPIWGGKLALLYARLKACFAARRAVIA